MYKYGIRLSHSFEISSISNEKLSISNKKASILIENLGVRSRNLQKMIVIYFSNIYTRFFYKQHFYNNTKKHVNFLRFHKIQVFMELCVTMEYDCLIFLKYLIFQMKNLVFQMENTVFRSKTLEYDRRTYRKRLSYIFEVSINSNEKLSISNEKTSILIESIGF